MQIKIIISKEAQDSFESCIEYVRCVLCQTKAARDIEEKFELFLEYVAMFPEMYPLMFDCRLRGKNLRRALVGNYVVIYKFEHDLVTILGFFHQMQDYARFF